MASRVSRGEDLLYLGRLAFQIGIAQDLAYRHAASTKAEPALQWHSTWGSQGPILATTCHTSAIEHMAELALVDMAVYYYKGGNP